MKYYLKGSQKGQRDFFAFDLPGEPDNIRRGSDPNRETYWVALATGRNSNNPSFVLDTLSHFPKTKKAGLRLLHLAGTILEYAGRMFYFTPLTELGFKLKTGALIFHTVNNYGLAIELDVEGKIIQSLHSQDGKTTFLSEVKEVISGNQKILYLGSLGNNYLGKLNLGPMKLAKPRNKTEEAQKKMKSQFPKHVHPGRDPFDFYKPTQSKPPK